MIEEVSGVVLLVLGLALTFLGRKLVKVLIFLVGGVIGAFLTFILAPLFLSPPFTYLAVIVGFVVFGLLSCLLYTSPSPRDRG